MASKTIALDALLTSLRPEKDDIRRLVQADLLQMIDMNLAPINQWHSIIREATGQCRLVSVVRPVVHDGFEIRTIQLCGAAFQHLTDQPDDHCLDAECDGIVTEIRAFLDWLDKTPDGRRLPNRARERFRKQADDLDRLVEAVQGNPVLPQPNLNLEIAEIKDRLVVASSFRDRRKLLRLVEDLQSRYPQRSELAILSSEIRRSLNEIKTSNLMLQEQRTATVDSVLNPGWLIRLIVALAMLMTLLGLFFYIQPPTITITEIPKAGPGGSNKLVPIAGETTKAKADEYVVLYALNDQGEYWIQPFDYSFKTAIEHGGHWSNRTREGVKYVALLVRSSYKPGPNKTDPPQVGGDVIAMVIEKGR